MGKVGRNIPINRCRAFARWALELREVDDSARLVVLEKACASPATEDVEMELEVDPRAFDDEAKFRSLTLSHKSSMVGPRGVSSSCSRT